MKAETTFSAILGRVLREFRRKKGLEQADIAKKMGLDRSSWSRVENGNTVLNIQQLQQIADIFGMKSNEILAKTNEIANLMKKQGYIVHYNTPKKVSSGGKGLALIGGAVLGLLVGSMLFGDGSDEDKKDEPTPPK